MPGLISTLDGSSSLFNKGLKESYHSSSGAITESIEKFSLPLKDFIKKDNINVLDTCFGLGYRSCAFAFVFKDSKVTITGIEIDPLLFDFMKVVHLPDNIMSFYKIFQRLSVNNSQISLPNGSCNVITNDFRVVLPKLNDKFDVILHDPFSPKKVPELWTLKIFKQLFDLLNPNGVLSTYSSSKVIRNNLREAGFRVINGPSVGRRSPSTIAIKF